jgi:hypothetical protein
VVLTMRPWCSRIRVDELAAMRLQTIEGAPLVRSHQPGVTRHVGGEYGRKAARRGRGQPSIDRPLGSSNTRPWAMLSAPSY